MATDNLINPQSTIRNPQFEVLTPQNVRDLRLPWLSKFNHDNLAVHVAENPGKSLRVAGANEYVVGEKWRGRVDIANVLEVTARRNKRALVKEWSARAEGDGTQTLLIAEDVWRDEPHLYGELGFGLIEKIVFFERDLPARFDWRAFKVDYSLPAIDFEPSGISDLDRLLALDHDSFPWLWWNCRDEMGSYLLMRDVFVYAAKIGEQPVGYASFTMYNGWAHLDRLAVVQKEQRRGYGAAQLVHTLGKMVEKGARNVGLSTQEHNVQSHRLYTRFGFKQGREAMGIYGRGMK